MNIKFHGDSVVEVGVGVLDGCGDVVGSRVTVKVGVVVGIGVGLETS